MESRWKVLGGGIAILLVLAAGAAAQQQLGETSVAISLPAPSEFNVLPGSPEVMGTDEDMFGERVLQQLPEDPVDIETLPDTASGTPTPAEEIVFEDAPVAAPLIDVGAALQEIIEAEPSADDEIFLRIVEEVVVTDMPVEDVTVENVLLTDVPVEDVPVRDVPVEDVPVEDALVEDAPIEDVPIEDVPVEDAPIEDVTLEDVPVEDVPVEDAPIENVPVEDVPVQDAPVEDVPTETVVSMEMLVQDRVVENVPMETLPEEEIMMIEIPVEDGPIEESDGLIEELPATPVPVDAAIEGGLLAEDVANAIEEDTAPVKEDFGEKIPEAGLPKSLDVRTSDLDDVDFPVFPDYVEDPVTDPSPPATSAPVSEPENVMSSDSDTTAGDPASIYLTPVTDPVEPSEPSKDELTDIVDVRFVAVDPAPVANVYLNPVADPVEPSEPSKDELTDIVDVRIVNDPELSEPSSKPNLPTSHFSYKAPKFHHRPSSTYGSSTPGYSPSYEDPTTQKAIPVSYDVTTSPPVSYTSKPISYKPPPPSYKALAPSYKAPAPSYKAPAPSYKAPAPSYKAPATSYKAPAPSYKAPVPTYKAPAPSYKAPAPSYKAPAPSYKAPAPSYKAPSPSYKAPAPSYKAPVPSYKAPNPVYKPIIAPLLIPLTKSGIIFPKIPSDVSYRPPSGGRRPRFRIPENILHLLKAPRPDYAFG